MGGGGAGRWPAEESVLIRAFCLPLGQFKAFIRWQSVPATYAVFSVSHLPVGMSRRGKFRLVLFLIKSRTTVCFPYFNIVNYDFESTYIKAGDSEARECLE